MKKWLTPSEAAEEMRCSERFVKDELRRKKLRGIKTGAGWRISPADIDVYMDAKANVRPVRRSA
ncbi:helix-turn-helix domain-containing protein [uncultured Nocardioides sp.]|jgi:excisionase family DNA binding protein|uniref:helix-turn-helix domain-containing protein n=1 Tax=uncultured Nocardioides sp. TaxID=198441 RepID=UPI0026075E5E|nr:helix-turn-helix domain-containing protein [uncultured Nocardioides sp.]HRD62914.1 helix-turn-helix domain-containing protein [Nocardioides sp.]